MNNQEIHYFLPGKGRELMEFSQMLRYLIQTSRKEQEIVVVCIGSDRATGDCLGPIIGERLSRFHWPIHIYGTLRGPVHAKNLGATIFHIQENHPGAFIIAIDASLGVAEHVGMVTMGTGSLTPGKGVNKILPHVGDLFITGIVNSSGLQNNLLLQTTRLSVVMELADFICSGLYHCLRDESCIIKKPLLHS